MNPKENKQKKNLRKLREPATVSEARLIENPDTWLLREQALAVDKAQEVMNDLYRERAKYGDGSCAFMVMKEQFEGGVGNPPKPLKDNTLHADKCRQYIKGFQRHRPNLPSEAQQKIDREIQKMQEALQWAEEYCNGNEPEIPRWAQPWKDKLGK
jgi:hypothetical protein